MEQTLNKQQIKWHPFVQSNEKLFLKNQQLKRYKTKRMKCLTKAKTNVGAEPDKNIAWRQIKGNQNKPLRAQIVPHNRSWDNI